MDPSDDDVETTGGQPREHELEADFRWGNTDAYRESARRTQRYTKEDWARMRAEAEANTLAMVEVMRAGKAPDSAEAKAAAELARLHISQWFYACDPTMHAMLGQMYVDDERFAATYEKVAPGLAAFMSAAVQANAADRGARTDVDDALASLKAQMGLGAPAQDVVGAGQVAAPEETLSKKQRKAAQREAKRRR